MTQQHNKLTISYNTPQQTPIRQSYHTTTMVPPIKPAAAYDPKGIHKAEIIYSTPLSSLLGLHDINQYIHSIPSLPPGVEFGVFLFGYAFNPVSIPLWMMLAALVGAAPASIVTESSSTNPQQPHLLFAPAFYLSTVLVTLVATEGCKASFRATRPEAILSQAFRSSKLRRYGTLVASLKSKHSFPSGDSAQAANAVLFLYGYVIPSWTIYSSGPTSSTPILAMQVLAFGVFYPGVAFARIFYHCHWIEDCLGGALLAGVLHTTVMPVVSDLVWRVVDRFLSA